MLKLRLSSAMGPERLSELLGSPERQALLEQITAAETLEEVLAAEATLANWMESHSDDFGMLDGGEVLANVKQSLVVAEAPQPGTPGTRTPT
jgi:hypothetical protein